jgi:hypothetical protein
MRFPASHWRSIRTSTAEPVAVVVSRMREVDPFNIDPANEREA